ncbi:unnamed protein product [Closterium sp. NIES-53]
MFGMGPEVVRVVSSRTRLSSGTTVLATPPCHACVACTPVSLCLVSPGPCPRSRGRLHRPAFPASRSGALLVSSYHCSFADPAHGRDVPVLRLHSDRDGEFCSHLLEDFCGAEGICQTYTLPASPQQNGIAERRIGLVMEVARTSMIHVAAPHFLWPFAVRYAVEQLNLWPRVSHPETSPTLRWTGEVGDASAFRVWGSLSLVRDLPTGKLSLRTLWCVFLGFPTDAPPWQFYHSGSRRVLSSQDVTFDKSVCFYHLHPHRSSLIPLPPLTLVEDPPPVAPLPPHGPAPLGVSQVDPPPLVEPLEVSSDTSGPAEGGDLTSAATVTPRRSARLAVPPGFPPRPSSPPLQPVTVDSSAAGGGTTGGAGFGGVECPLGTGGTGGTSAGGPATSRQEALSPERLREWAVQWGSPGGGASRLRAGGVGTAGAGGAGTAGDGGSATGGTVVARTGGAGARRRATLSSERLREWAVQWGSPGGGVSCARSPRDGGIGGAAAMGAAAGSLGARRQASLSPERLRASAGVLGTRGTGAVGGAGTAGGVGGADTGGTTGGTVGAVGGTGVSGASRQESLSPLQLRERAVRWGSPGGGAGGTGSGGAVTTGAGGIGSGGVVATGARGTGSGGAVATGAGGSRGATTQLQTSALSGLLSLPPAATEFPTRASTPERRELETRASTPVRGRRVVRPRAPAVPGTHRMSLRPSSVPQRVVRPSPPASSLPHILDPESDLVRAASLTVTCLLAAVMIDPSFESAAASALVTELVDFAALCCLDYAASLVFDSSCPPSVKGELALGCDIFEDRQFELECLAATTPHLAFLLLFPEGDPDALDIPTPRIYAEAITGPYSSQWQTAMDAEMASWKSTCTYVKRFPHLGRT